MSSRRVLSLAGVFCLTVVAACSQSEVIVGVSDPGAAARITFEDWGYAGGHGFRTSLTLDSASATYTVETCTEGVGVSCDENKQRRTGAVQADVRDQLFRRTYLRDFRSLRAEYRRDGAVMIPDPGAAKLTVTAGERTRTLEWEKGAVVPALLDAYVCNLRAATGELITCLAI